ncbi:MAG: tocopherol cyclase family protein [Oscillospiraceae bacterium]
MQRATYYHGTEKRGPYFEGWYLKHQTKGGEALALIPALHIDCAGQRSASLQVLADDKAWWLEYPAEEFHASEREFQIRMGQNRFSRKEVRLDVERDGLSFHGTLRCGPFTPLGSDIMGPFRLLSGMECSHGVISMGHSLEGTLILNGKRVDFSDGTGYVETDRGRSFPSAYLWTQCTWREPQRGSLLLSIATIPLAIGHFTGCICAVLYNGQEYRLATYRGARIERWSGAGAVIRQGKYRLSAELLEGRGCPLRAPAEGSMGRTIRESLCAQMRYRFWRGEKLLLEHTDRCASFEYADERERHF